MTSVSSWAWLGAVLVLLLLCGTEFHGSAVVSRGEGVSVEGERTSVLSFSYSKDKGFGEA